VDARRETRPLIPTSLLDAPSQRFYILALYFALVAWKFYDYFELVAYETNSLWIFMKWSAIDGAFLYGLPGLQIPWLEWGSFTITTLFLGHALADALLMFRIPVRALSPQLRHATHFAPDPY